MKRKRDEQLMCMVVVYFEELPDDPLLLGKVIQSLHASEPKLVSYGYAANAVQPTVLKRTGTLHDVMKTHRDHLANSDALCYGAGRGRAWDVHFCRENLSLRPLPHPAHMRTICRITKSTDAFSLVNGVFNAVDNVASGVWHGFAVADTLDWLHYGHRFIDAVQPLSWQENVETFAWRFNEPHWATRIRDVYWGTYLGPTLAKKLPASLRTEGSELIRAERFDEDFIWNTHPSGGVSVFVSRDPLQTANIDLPMPDDFSFIKAGWLRAKLRDCDLI